MSEVETKKCRECQTDISFKAKKCPNCLSDQRDWIQRHPIITIVLVLVIFPIVLAMLTPSGNIEPTTPEEPFNTKIGEASVYKEISESTDCEFLQEKFDLAESHGNRNRLNGKLELSRISTEYMKAIDYRMEQSRLLLKYQ